MSNGDQMSTKRLARLEQQQRRADEQCRALTTVTRNHERRIQALEDANDEGPRPRLGGKK